jgi:hypothetical protein
LLSAKENPVDKNVKKKPMFLMKETLVNLTPGQMGQVQGATDCIGVTTAGFDLSCYSKCEQVDKPL